MTVYLINDTSRGGDRVLTAQEVLSLELLLSSGALKEVERCKHGSIDPHDYKSPEHVIMWCRGAGIGGNE